MPAHTRSRLAAAIAREVADILEFEVKDPAVRVAAPTVVGARLTAKGQHAVVAVAVDGDATTRDQAVAALVRDRAFIRTRLAQRIPVRRIPQLDFVLASPEDLVGPDEG